MQRKKKLMILCSILSFIVLTGMFTSKYLAGQPMNARNFPLNGQYSGDTWLDDTEEEHWYRVYIPSDGVLEIRMMSYCSGNLHYNLYNEDLSVCYTESCGNYVSPGSESSPVTGTVSKILSTGTYYFCLSGATGRYRLYGAFYSYGANDYGADSYDSPFNYSSGASVIGALTETDTEDWYRFTLSGRAYCDITITSYCSDSLEYELYNSDLSAKILSDDVYGGSASSPKTQKIEKQLLPAGTYYLKIYGATGKYVLKINPRGGFGSSQKKKLSLSVSAKHKNNKITVTVKTAPYAKITAKYRGKTKTTTANSAGKGVITIQKKWKKGKKVKVTVKKSGYTQKSKSVKVK